MVIETYLSKEMVQTPKGLRLVQCIKDPNGHIWVSASDLGIKEECSPRTAKEKPGESGFPDVTGLLTPQPQEQP
jgi:hypothetical protein